MEQFHANNNDFVPTEEQEQIIAKLEQHIFQLTSGRIRDLKVQEVGNTLLLSGRTNTYYIKQLATQIALDTHHPQSLDNSIEVVMSH